jgi:mono/diheme cytochrome c family protein
MKKTLCFILLAFTLLNGKEFNTPMKTYMEGLSAEAKAANPSFTSFDAKRGEALFFSKHTGKKGTEMSCVTCHSSDLKKGGQNVNTNKPITALAPSVNSTRLTDVAEVEKWLRRNFNDVFAREGTALEKGDVLTYIINQ